MRVVRLTAENFKRLVAVDITPTGDVVTISGANAAGKSSVLDAIWLALSGRASKDVTVVRQGENRSTVTLDLGDLTVERVWVDGKTGSTLTVKSAGGAKLTSPQSVLDQLVGSLSFDPLKFANSNQDKQLAMLREVISLPFDPAEYTARRQAAYDKRTDRNREAKRLQGVLSSMRRPLPNAPTDEMSMAEVANELTELQGKVVQLRQATDEWHNLNRQITELTAKLNEVHERGKALMAELPPDPEKRLIELRNSMQTVDMHNSTVRETRAWLATKAELDENSKASENLTREMEQLDKWYEDVMATVDMPVPGLSFNERDGVLLNGVPFRQASAAERLRTSVAIGMKANPDFRVMLVSDASLLDSKNLQIIEEMAGENDFQVWIERVDESGEVGVVIEDGLVKGSQPLPPGVYHAPLATPVANFPEGWQSLGNILSDGEASS